MKEGRAEDIIRQKINKLETVDDESSIDTDKIWERLNKSLDNKPVKKIRPTYYWAAAAMLLVMIGVIALFPQKSPVARVDKPSKIPAQSLITIEKNKPEGYKPEQQKLSATQQKRTQKRLIAVRHPRKRIANTSIAESLMRENQSTQRSNEKSRLFGLDATPIITAACYNTKIENSLLCYGTKN